MIGPHEERELELMLSGKKKLALFHDVLIEGQEIMEEIIPEKAFAPYVQNRKIIRTHADIKNAKNGDIFHFVFFCLPGEEWRAHTVIWLKKQVLEEQKPFNEHDDVIIGRLLGYEEDDIRAFLLHRRDRTTK